MRACSAGRNSIGTAEQKPAEWEKAHSVAEREHAECKGFAWSPALAVDGIVVAAAKLAGDSALAASPLARGTEGAPPQPTLLPLPQQGASLTS